jgi:hypothetical protein
LFFFYFSVTKLQPDTLRAKLREGTEEPPLHDAPSQAWKLENFSKTARSTIHTPQPSRSRSNTAEDGTHVLPVATVTHKHIPGSHSRGLSGDDSILPSAIESVHLVRSKTESDVNSVVSHSIDRHLSSAAAGSHYDGTAGHMPHPKSVDDMSIHSGIHANSHAAPEHKLTIMVSIYGVVCVYSTPHQPIFDILLAAQARGEVCPRCSHSAGNLHFSSSALHQTPGYQLASGHHTHSLGSLSS